MLNIQTLKNTLNNYILNLKIHLRELGSPMPYRSYVSEQNAKDKGILQLFIYFLFVIVDSLIPFSNKRVNHSRVLHTIRVFTPFPHPWIVRLPLESGGQDFPCIQEGIRRNLYQHSLIVRSGRLGDHSVDQQVHGQLLPVLVMEYVPDAVLATQHHAGTVADPVSGKPKVPIGVR